MAEVNLVDNDAGGFNDRVEVEDGISVVAFFASQKPNADISDFIIRVNGESRASTYVLEHNDRVTFSPRKVEGA